MVALGLEWLTCAHGPLDVTEVALIDAGEYVILLEREGLHILLQHEPMDAIVEGEQVLSPLNLRHIEHECVTLSTLQPIDEVIHFTRIKDPLVVDEVRKGFIDVLCACNHFHHARGLHLHVLVAQCPSKPIEGFGWYQAHLIGELVQASVLLEL
jgi:hypothetical protein